MLQELGLRLTSPVALWGITTIFVAVLVYQHVLYPAFISPLARIPNVHITSPFSRAWIRAQRRQGKTGTRRILEAHRKYGPVVRISPNELSIHSLDGLRQAYIGGFEKTPWYQDFQNYSTPNLVSMLHNRPHSMQKRMISNVYSKSYVQSSPDLLTVSRVMLHDRLFPLLEDAARSGARLNAYKMNIGLGADFMNAYLFGSANGTNFIQDLGALEEVLIPFNIKFRSLPGKEAAGKQVEDHILAMCTAAEGTTAPPYSFNMSLPPTQPVVYGQLLSRLSKEPLLSTSPPRIIAASEMMDQIAAAIETTRVALTYVQWELSQRPDLTNDLRKELLTLDPPIVYRAGQADPLVLPDAKAIDALPLLNAVLKEILRLYTPSPGMFPRVTPPEGAVIDGYKIPGGVSVAAAGYCLHRNESVFPDSDSFIPDRWLQDNTKGVDGGPGPKTEQNKWFWAFGSGGRMCIGSHYSVYMLKLCIAALYTNYTTTIVDDTNIEQEDAFIAGPQGETLVLQVHLAS